MALEIAKPAVWGGRPRVKLDCWAAPSVPENKAATVDIQAPRARWLAQRYRLAPTMAATIAELAFVEAAR
jgi:hypothetical protein